jgi:hypothetical protein
MVNARLRYPLVNRLSVRTSLERAANSVSLEHLFRLADGVFAFLLDAVQLQKASRTRTTSLVPTFLSPNPEIPARWSQPGQVSSLATDRHSPYIVCRRESRR